MKIRYLLDENIDPSVLPAIQQWDINIDILRVGQQDAPAIGTLDPEILLYCESEQRALVTENRVSMATHLATHFQTGHEH